MTTEIDTPRQPMIRCYGQSLPPQQRSKHRAWIGVRVTALLAHYWQASQPTEAALAMIVADWVDALDHYTPQEITEACRAWVSREPRKRPNFGDIAALIVADRAERRRALPKQEDEGRFHPLPIDAAERKQIADDIIGGFLAKHGRGDA